MTKQYSIAEVFETIQGEGSYAGTPAIFVRLAGCNMWSGFDADRERDAERNDARCPLFCDTDFRPRMKLTAEEICELVCGYAEKGGKLLVITGGEPLLQLDAKLVAKLMSYLHVSIETNGTVTMPDDMAALTRGTWRLWVTCSPKQAAERLRLDPRVLGELKVVFPSYDPLSYVPWLGGASPKLYIQPTATVLTVGTSIVDESNMALAAQWCMDHPAWQLSLQTHKFLHLA